MDRLQRSANRAVYFIKYIDYELSNYNWIIFLIPIFGVKDNVNYSSTDKYENLTHNSSSLKPSSQLSHYYFFKINIMQNVFFIYLKESA